MSNPDWISKTKYKPSAIIDIGFWLPTSFNFVAKGEPGIKRYQDQSIPLYTPKVIKYRNYVMTHQNLNNIDELIRYYKDLFSKFAKYKKQPANERLYFWLRPMLFFRDEFQITFPWYDTLSESENFLKALTKKSNGELYSDVDQGWEIIFFADDKILYVWRSNPEDEKDQQLLNFDRVMIADQIPGVLERTQKIVSQLTKEFGRNYWDRR